MPNKHDQQFLSETQMFERDHTIPERESRSARDCGWCKKNLSEETVNGCTRTNCPQKFRFRLVR